MCKVNSSVQFFYLILLLILPQLILCQEEEPNIDRQRMVSFNVGYATEFKGGKLAERYGNNLAVILGAGYLTPTNLVLEGETIIRFGDEVKEDVLLPYRNENGVLIGNDGLPSLLYFREGGLSLSGVIGKIISFNDSQSGLRVGMGLGYMAHKIRFLDDSRNSGLIAGEYAKGYDRLTGGWFIKQQLGYEVHSSSGRLNGNILLEVTQGFTQSKRGYQYDIGVVSESKGIDIVFGLRATFMLPVVRDIKSEKTIYY